MLPIGERFALISLTAAFFDARVTFVALLAWGGLALAWTTYGRLSRSLGSRRETAVTAAVDSASGPLQTYRDDGAVARLLGRIAGPARRIPPIALLLAGGLPLLAAGAFAREDASWWLIGACVGWVVLCGGLSSGRPLRDRLRWAVPQLLRAIELGAIIWIASATSDDADPAAFALLLAIAFRHYDVAYRFAQRGTTPPRAPRAPARRLGRAAARHHRARRRGRRRRGLLRPRRLHRRPRGGRGGRVLAARRPDVARLRRRRRLARRLPAVGVE